MTEETYPRQYSVLCWVVFCIVLLLVSFYSGNYSELDRIVTIIWASILCVTVVAIGKVPEFTRQFLHLQPDTIVIFDRVTAGEPDYEKRWLLHTIEKPKVTGKTALVTHLQGRLFSMTLLPTDARVEVVGGPGKEFWSDGKNYPISNKSKECEPGAWRIEVYPGAPRERDFFCHLLFTADPSREAAPAVQMTDGEHVELSFTDAGRTYVVSFTKDGPVGGHVKVSEGTTVLIDQDFTRTVRPQRFEPAEAWK